jgi:hypothetical protein
LGLGGGRGRFGFFGGVLIVLLPSPAFHSASHSRKPAGGAQSSPSAPSMPVWPRTTLHTIAPCFARRQLSQRFRSKGMSLGSLPRSLARAMVLLYVGLCGVYAASMQLFFAFLRCRSVSTLQRVVLALRGAPKSKGVTPSDVSERLVSSSVPRRRLGSKSCPKSPMCLSAYFAPNAVIGSPLRSYAACAVGVRQSRAPRCVRAVLARREA